MLIRGTATIHNRTMDEKFLYSEPSCEGHALQLQGCRFAFFFGIIGTCVGVTHTTLSM